MKVSSKTVEENFKPIELNIVIESPEEARAFYAIFNHMDNSELLGRSTASQIRDVFSEFSVALGNEVIANGVTYHEFYR
jgi:hypothetical protein